jgi:Protein of unknown function (DUF3570)
VAATERRRATPRSARGAALVATWAAFAACTARAEDRGSAAVFVYVSDDQLTVVHPSASVRADVAEDTELSAGYDADVITAATADVRTVAYRATGEETGEVPDVVSGASVRPFHEMRNGLSLGIDHGFSRTLRGRAGYRFSHSPDYLTNAGSLGLALDDAGKNRTLSLSLSAAQDKVGRVGDDGYVGTLASVGATAGLSVLLGARAIAEVLVAFEEQLGFMENPYRTLPLYAPDAPDDPLEHYLEQVPDDRARFAAEGRLRVGFTRRWFGRTHLRIHADDWGVLGMTTGLGVALEPARDWLWSVDGRLYLQRAASFYRGRYYGDGEVPALRTADRELARSGSLSVGTRLDWGFADWLGFGWRLNASAEVIGHRYDDTPRLPEVLAFQAGLGLVAGR